MLYNVQLVFICLLLLCIDSQSSQSVPKLKSSPGSNYDAHLAGPFGSRSYVAMVMSPDSFLMDVEYGAAVQFACEVNIAVNPSENGSHCKDYYCIKCYNSSQSQNGNNCSDLILGGKWLNPDSTGKLGLLQEIGASGSDCTGDFVAIDLVRHDREWIIEDWYLNRTVLNSWADFDPNGDGTVVTLTMKETGKHQLHTNPKFDSHGFNSTRKGVICEANEDHTNDPNIKQTGEWKCLEVDTKKHCYHCRSTNDYFFDQKRFCKENGGYLFAPTTKKEAETVIAYCREQLASNASLELYIGIQRACSLYLIGNGTRSWNNSVWSWGNNTRENYDEALNMPECYRIYSDLCKMDPNKCPIGFKNMDPGNIWDKEDYIDIDDKTEDSGSTKIYEYSIGVTIIAVVLVLLSLVSCLAIGGMIIQESRECLY